MVLLRFVSVISVFAMMTVLLAQIGCAGHPALPDVTSGPYTGPGMALDSSAAEYAVVVQAPTPGWVVGLDRVAEQYRHHAVFITLRRPNPGYLYPQVIVEQRIATTVPTTGAVKVYARILDPDTRDSKAPYIMAGEGAGTLKRR